MAIEGKSIEFEFIDFFIEDDIFLDPLQVQYDGIQDVWDDRHDLFLGCSLVANGMSFEDDPDSTAGWWIDFAERFRPEDGQEDLGLLTAGGENLEGSLNLDQSDAIVDEKEEIPVKKWQKAIIEAGLCVLVPEIQNFIGYIGGFSIALPFFNGIFAISEMMCPLI